MKNLSRTLLLMGFFLVLLRSEAVFAQTYTLYTDSHCANRELALSFKCKAGTSPLSPSKLVISKEKNNKWSGVEKGEAFPLSFIKEDQYILILGYPVLYSGMAHIVLMKKTGRFYFTEIAYSPVLEEQGYDVEAGRFEFKN
jgi:hypothetical protein